MSLKPDITMSYWTRIGMLTPSSFAVLEPMTARILAPFGNAVTAHFARFLVTQISMDQGSQNQFKLDPILAAADLLSDAHSDVIAWNGTSASWLGFHTDEALVQAIRTRTGIEATSTILALNKAIRLLGLRRLGLVTPYLSEIQDRLIANHEQIDVEIVADRRLKDRGNFCFACYSPRLVADLIREAADARPDAIAVVCTNFRGADLIEQVERETGVIVLDSAVVTLWDTLRMCRRDPTRITKWGRLLREGK